MKCPHCDGKKCQYCLRTGRQLTIDDRDFYARKMRTRIFTAVKGNNDAIINNALLLYSKPGDKIIDVTFAHGNFWRNIDLSIYNFLPTDLTTGIDFRDLPYSSNTMDIAVIDPPYMSGGTSERLSLTYNNIETTAGMSHQDILNLYSDGMLELKRVLKPGGTMWVKCQDESLDYTHIELYNIARKMHLEVMDMLILVQYSTTPVFGIQQHAKKNHSYLWIFKKAV